MSFFIGRSNLRTQVSVLMKLFLQRSNSSQDPRRFQRGSADDAVFDVARWPDKIEGDHRDLLPPEAGALGVPPAERL
jgi:hypothetical protein